MLMRYTYDTVCPVCSVYKAVDMTYLLLFPTGN
jgi:hypothetical protein